MKHLLLITLLLLLVSAAHAQVSKQYVRHGTGSPSVCPLGTVYVDDTTGNVYVNKLGSCQLVSGSGSAASLTVNLDAAPYYGIGSSTTTTTTGTNASGASTINVASSSSFSASQGVYIAGAGAAGANYIGTVQSVPNGTSIVVSPAISTTVSAGAKVQHDNTAAFNSAIAAVVTAGGGTIDLPDVDTYRVNGAFDARTNSVITFPANPFSTLTKLIPVRIRGAVPPSFAADYKGVIHGTIIQSDKTGSGTVPAVIATNPWAAFVGGTPESNLKNYIVPTLENLIVRTYDNPSIAAIQFSKAIGAQLVNVDVDEGLASKDVSQPTTDIGGIYMPQAENYGLSYLSRVYVTGYKRGIYAADHAHFNEVLFERDYTALVLEDAAALAYGNLDIYFCKEAIRANNLNGSNVDFSLHHERNDGSFAGQWYDVANPEFIDVNNNTAGLIRYRITGHTTGEGLGDAAAATLTGFSHTTFWNLGQAYTLSTGGGSGGSTFTDNFNRADGAVGSGWTQLTGATFNVFSNQLSLNTGATGDAMYFATAGQAVNPFVSLKITTATSTSVGVLLRVQDNSNYYLIDFGNTNVTLFKKVAGTYTQVDQYATSGIAAGTQTSVTITPSGNTFTVNKGGTTFTLTDASSAFTGVGYTGLRNGDVGTGNRLVDDFTVSY